jgi:hypothetical protein
MLYEYTDFLATIKSILEKEKAISDNSGVDDIDLNEFDVVPSELISACFANSGAVTMPVIIAQREAAEIVTAHRRALTEYNKDRSHYYEQAVEDLDNVAALFDYTDAVLKRLIRMGDG